MAKANIHRRAELENLIRFETLISDISARFVRLLSSEVDSEIERALRQILDFFNVDRCGIMGVSEDNKFVWVTHICCTEGIEPVSKDIDLATLFPWSYEKLITKGEPVIVSRMTDLPPEAEQDRTSWAAMGAKSNLAISLLSAQGVRHLLAIHSIHKERDWPQEFIPRLKLLGEIFVSALERDRSEQALKEGKERLMMALDAAGAGAWSMDSQSKSVWASASERKMFGFSADEHITFDSFMHVIHPDDRESVRRAVEKTLRTKTPLSVEYRIIQPDGSVCWIVTRGNHYCNAKGEPDRLMGVSVNITERKRAEKNLFDSREALRAFASKLLTIQEEERRRLARELHDDFTQRLAVLAMDMSRLEVSAKAAETKFAPKLKHIRDQIIKLSTDMHDISRQLHPSIIDDLGLRQAIESECVNFTKHTGIVINYKPINIPLKISRDISVGLFRITQEALRNVQKYAHVKNADVCLAGGDNSITLTIHDSGAGFDPACARGKHGLGLFSMEERAQLIQGVFSIDSAPGGGTRIKVVVPLRGIESE